MSDPANRSGEFSTTGCGLAIMVVGGFILLLLVADAVYRAIHGWP